MFPVHLPSCSMHEVTERRKRSSTPKMCPMHRPLLYSCMAPTEQSQSLKTAHHTGGKRLPRNVPLLSDRYYSQLAALNTAEQMNRAEFHFQKTFSTHPDKRLYSSFSPWQLWFHRPLVKPPFDRKGEAGSQAGERVSGNFIRTGARVG